MTTTPNLDITHIGVNQNNKEVTCNDAFTNLDKAMCEKTSQDISQTDWSVPLLTMQRMQMLEVTNVGASLSKVTVPAMKRLFLFKNGDGTNAVKIAVGTTEQTVNAGEIYLFYADGTTNGLFTIALPESVRPYYMALYVPGTLGSSEVLIRHLAPLAIDFPTSLTQSLASAETAATAETILSIKKNGSEFGTITFAASGTTGVFASASGSSFTAGDVLTIVGPATADSTLAGVTISLYSSQA